MGNKRRLRLSAGIGSGPLVGLVSCATLLLLSGCGRPVEPLVGAEKLEHATSAFEIYWPPQDPEKAQATSVTPLLHGMLTLDVREQPEGGPELRLSVTLTRPSTEDDRERWNSVLAFADVPWMEQVRVWDADEKWLWPNLPYLLRLPGRERIERYGGMDPGKHVDNDFAAVLIRKYDAAGTVESADTKDAPLVSAEWRAVGSADTDGNSVVHVAQSDEFVLHVDKADRLARGQFKVWLIYADFLQASPPASWPRVAEWAGGILAYFEVDWEMSREHGLRGILRHRRPPVDTGFRWSDWVVRPTGSAESESQVRLTDIATSR